LLTGFHTHHSRLARVRGAQQGQAVVEVVLVGGFKQLEIETQELYLMRKASPVFKG